MWPAPPTSLVAKLHRLWTHTNHRKEVAWESWIYQNRLREVSDLVPHFYAVFLGANADLGERFITTVLEHAGRPMNEDDLSSLSRDDKLVEPK